MADAKGAKTPDPLGKRALYGVHSSAREGKKDSPDEGGSTVPRRVGKRALYSGSNPGGARARAALEIPLVEPGVFTVRCQRCRQASRVGLIDLLIFQFPIGMWIPRGTFDRRMTCPSCRKRSWCSVTLRRD
jgi:hypothetical protein